MVEKVGEPRTSTCPNPPRDRRLNGKEDLAWTPMVLCRTLYTAGRHLSDLTTELTAPCSGTRGRNRA